MTRVVEPLGRQADRERIIEKLANVLADEVRRREKKLKKGDGKDGF